MQLDVYDVLDLIDAEDRTVRNEARAGQPCDECPDPALCQAERECLNEGASL